MPIPFSLPPHWSPRALTSIRTQLLQWFARNHRNLPWRATRDPYRIWVSEVMLQQTTVAAVVPYFARFLAAFPTVRALADADEQQVLKLWEGLGYYRRARHLHAAAKQLVENHGDELPDDPAIWSNLPGVGRYILGAVLSQAFDRKLPIVEANSLRVLCRLFSYQGDPRTTEGKKWLWNAAATVLPRKRIGDFNQAVMELGAMVCTPDSPRCGICPLASLCSARRDGLESSIPPKKRLKAKRDVREIAVVIRDRGQVLLCQRRANAARWQSMWEVPHGEIREGESRDEAALRVPRELTGLKIAIGPTLLTIRHTVTHHAIEMECVAAKRTSGKFRSDFYAEGRWVKPDELGDYPVSSPQRKLMNALVASC